MEQLAGDAFRRVGSLRLAADDAERRRAPARVRRAPRATASRSSGSTSSIRRSTGSTAAAIHHPPDGALQPARWVRRLARARGRGGRRDREEHVAVDARRARRGRGRRRRRRATRRRSSPSSAAFVQPTRGQVLATEPLPELLYARPHYARGGYDYWQQLPDGRLVLGGRRDARSRPRRRTSTRRRRWSRRGSRRSSSELIGRPPRVTHRWAGIWGRRPTCCRSSARCRGATASGSRAATRVTATCSASRAATSSRARSSASGPPELELFDPARFARTERCELERGRSRPESSRALERRERDREILDREPGRVEDRDLVGVRPARRRSRRARAERRSRRPAHEPRLDGVRELAAVARLLPVVAEETRPRELAGRRSRPCRARRRPSG